jgi:hypothetical protein
MYYLVKLINAYFIFCTCSEPVKPVAKKAAVPAKQTPNGKAAPAKNGSKYFRQTSGCEYYDCKDAFGHKCKI